MLNIASSQAQAHAQARPRLLSPPLCTLGLGLPALTAVVATSACSRLAFVVLSLSLVLFSSVLAHCSCVLYSSSLACCLRTSSAGTRCSLWLYTTKSRAMFARLCSSVQLVKTSHAKHNQCCVSEALKGEGLVGARRRSHWACKHIRMRSCLYL